MCRSWWAATNMCLEWLDCLRLLINDVSLVFSGSANQLRGFHWRSETSPCQCFPERTGCLHRVEQTIWQLECMSKIQHFTHTYRSNVQLPGEPRSSGCRLTFLLHLFQSVHPLDLWTNQNISYPLLQHPTMSFSAMPSVSNSICLHRCTTLDPVNVNFALLMSKPSQSTLLNYQTHWIQTQQFSDTARRISQRSTNSVTRRMKNYSAKLDDWRITFYAHYYRHHPLHSQRYNLRHRTHSLQLLEHSTHLSDSNFLIRMLYKNSY